MKSSSVNHEATLYIVATPIGNLGDITLRALEVLKAVEIIACEDTRVSGTLLKHYGIKTKTMSYHDHNADDVRPKIVALLASGKSVALISDAGTPLISDPGYKLVRACREAGIKVSPLPGASSVMAALTVSGLPTDSFMFIGFLPTTTKAREALLQPLRPLKASLVVFSTGSKLGDDLRTLHAALGERDVALTRELTKMYEEVVQHPITALITRIETHGAPKGEMVLVVGGSAGEAPAIQDIDALLKERLQHLSVKEAVAEVAALMGLPRNQVYAQALALKDGK
jgi:16S rRNA (cytidine1402-2'-O)-methyltransferase